MQRHLNVGILGDSTSLDKLFGSHPDPLQGGVINWQLTASAHQCDVFTSTLPDQPTLPAASSWTSAIDLDLVVFSFSVLPRCWAHKPRFAPAFAWADSHFRARRASPQVAVLLVGDNAPSQGSAERLITNLVGRNPYLEALNQAGRVRWWSASQQHALANQSAAAVGWPAAVDQPQELSEHMLHTLTSLLQQPVVSRLPPGGTTGTGSRFATGCLACCFAVLLLLLALHLSPSLEGAFVGWFLPTHSSLVADLQARTAGLSDNASRLAMEKEVLIKRAAEVEVQKDILIDRTQVLESLRKQMREELDQAIAKNKILQKCCSVGPEIEENL